MRRSDMKLSPEAHAVILRRVALTALTDSRKAWRLARKRPTIARVRAAFRACVFAARSLRKASEVLPAEVQEMLAEAERVDRAAATMKARLVRMTGWKADE